MKSTLVAAACLLLLSESADARPWDIESGVRFLTSIKMSDDGFDLSIFQDRTTLYELRLYIVAPAYGVDERLVEVVTEAGKSAMYSLDEKSKKWTKATDYTKVRAGQAVRFHQKDFLFLCGVGLAFLVLD